MKGLFLIVLISFLAITTLKGNHSFPFKEKTTVIDTPPPKAADTIKYLVGERPILPSFVGGDSARIEYLKRNIQVDYKRFNDSFPRTVWVKVIIDTLGRVTNPKIVKNGLDSLFNSHIAKVLIGMPRWSPSEWYGERIKTTLIVPVKFKRKED